MNDQINIIKQYIRAYNEFDIGGMFMWLDPEIIFENYSNGQLIHSTHGISEFKRLALETLTLFSWRSQNILGCENKRDSIEVSIDYKALLATDLPGRLKAGEILALNGKSTFQFKNGKITMIKDES